MADLPLLQQAGHMFVDRNPAESWLVGDILIGAVRFFSPLVLVFQCEHSVSWAELTFSRTFKTGLSQLSSAYALLTVENKNPKTGPWAPPPPPPPPPPPAPPLLPVTT